MKINIDVYLEDELMDDYVSGCIPRKGDYYFLAKNLQEYKVQKVIWYPAIEAVDIHLKPRSN